jgi:hypothetical protein
MVRCIVTFTLSLLVVPLAAEAQPAGKVYRIGILSADTASGASTTGFMEVFRQGLRDLGWVGRVPPACG